MSQYTIAIEGMGCDHCVNAVKDALLAAGSEAVTVTLGSASAVFKGGADVLKAAIEEAGYDVISIAED